MKNWLPYMGFLGLLGLLAPFTHNPGFAGFFGFFAFFGFKNIVFDERFEANVNKACRNTFVLSILIYALSAVFASISTYTMTSIYTIAFAISFALQILVFTFSFQYYENHSDY